MGSKLLGGATALRRGGIVKSLLRMSAVAAAMTLAACSNFSFPDVGNPFQFGGSQPPQVDPNALPTAAGQSLGTGPVRVALLLPLTGDVATVGTSMANSATLAMDYIQNNANIADNITLVIKDTGSNSNIAAQKASEAVSEGASLILGPLKAESVRAAGGVARAAGVPLIGFSNNSGAAAPGVYLLNVLPEVEVKRSLAYAQEQGKRSVAAIVPNSAYGQIQEGALRQAASELNMTIQSVFRFSSEDEARNAVAQLTPFLQQGAIDTLFIPDRATAPSFGALLDEAQIDRSNLLLIGSLDWDGDLTIPQSSAMVGAIYPALDSAGYQALRPEYESRFGGTPHAFSTLSYTAVLLANSPALSQSQPRYDQAQLTRPSGFNGRDGVFRLLTNGRSQYALAIKQIVVGGAQQIDGAKIP